MAKRTTKKLTKTEKNVSLILAILIVIATVFLSYGSKVSEKAPDWTDAYKAVGLTEGADDIYKEPFTVTYIDVGQGDSIFINSEDCKILIDSGERGNADKILSRLSSLGVDTVDYLIATHPHSDHIGSFPEVMKKLKVKNVIMPELSSENMPATTCYKKFLEAVKTSKATAIAAVPGDVYSFGDVSFKILAPSQQYDDLNNMSVVLRLTYKNTSFIFTGDAEAMSEKQILSFCNETGEDLKSDVLKVGHHGSDSSTSEEFLTAVDPKLCIIMCGKDNDYGHPHEVTLDKISKIGAEVLRTDKNGTIVVASDGNSIKSACIE